MPKRFKYDLILIAIAIVAVALITFAANAKPANAHVIETADCSRFASMASFVGLMDRPTAFRLCKLRSTDHAYAHCAMHREYTGRNACAIRLAFGTYGEKAVRVARCESTLRLSATNGQYRGLFQVSTDWRNTIPGFGSTARSQAEHGFKVFRAVNYHWSPTWECSSA